MTDFYVDSNATGANNGTSWTDAWTSITSAPGGISAGDRVFVASDHSESQASLMSLSWPGTVASLNHIISADSTSGTPPTTQTSGASVATTGANDIQIISSGYIYMWGIAFNAGDGASLASIIIANSSAGSDSVLEDCVFVLGNTSSSSRIIIANDTDAKVYLKNCNFQFDAATQGVNTGTIGAPFIVDGGSLIGSTFPNNFIANTADETRIFISGFDFSSGSSSMNIIGDTDSNITGYVRNCKLPSSWTGSLRTTNQLGSDIILSNSDNSDTNYNYEKITHTGNILSETTIVKDSGASDGATVLSWKMVSNANAIYPKNTLESTEIVKWNGVVGSSITVTVDFIHDSLTNLQDDEIWLEVQYLGTSGFPLSLFIDDAAADYLATPADQATSSATWTTTGLTNPNEQQLSVTFTPQEKGYIHAKVYLAKASYTVYVDPELQVS